MPKTALEPPLAPLVCCLRKDGASGRTHVCNGDGTGHLLDEHHAVGSAVLRRKSGYFDKTDELQKRLPHSRIFRERDISPILPVRPGYVELPVAPIAPSLARSHVSRALAS